jgi:putative protease
VRYLKDLEVGGVDSFKVEGRTKSLYYVSAVAKAYRDVMENKITSDEGFEDLRKVGNRGYTQGFFLGDNNYESYSYDISKGLAGADFLCIFLDNDGENYKVEIKNKILLNDEIEIITHNEKILARVLEIKDENKNTKDVANTNDIVWLKLSNKPENFAWALGRTVGIKNELDEKN